MWNQKKDVTKIKKLFKIKKFEVKKMANKLKKILRKMSWFFISWTKVIVSLNFLTNNLKKNMRLFVLPIQTCLLNDVRVYLIVISL